MKKRKNRVLIILSVILTLGILFFAYHYQNFRVSTSSMASTLLPDDIVLSDITINSAENIQRNKIYTFHFPLGDTIVVEEPAVYYEQLIRDNAVQGNISIDESRKMIKQNYTVEPRGLSQQTQYIFRITGIAGDTIESKNSVLFINGTEVTDNKHIQYSYKVTTDGSGFNEKLLKKHGILNDEILQTPYGYGEYTMNLTKQGAEKITQLPHVKTVEKIIQPNGYEYKFWSNPIFPHHSGYNWSRDNFGPFVIPKKGSVVKLTINNLPLYERIIRVYENNELKTERNRVFINNEPVRNYVFKQNYYWVMGDNRHNSQDSRYWGFVPEDHITGELRSVIYSSRKESEYFKDVE